MQSPTIKTLACASFALSSLGVSHTHAIDLGGTFGAGLSYASAIETTYNVVTGPNGINAKLDFMKTNFAKDFTMQEWLQNVMGPSWGQPGQPAGLPLYNIESIYNKVTGLESSVAGLQEFAGGPFTIDDWLRHVMGPNWGQPGQPAGLPLYNLENIYDTATAISTDVENLPDLYWKFANSGNPNNMFNRINQVYSWQSNLVAFDLPRIETKINALGGVPVAVTNLGTALSNLSGVPLAVSGLSEQLGLLSGVPAELESQAGRLSTVEAYVDDIPGLVQQVAELTGQDGDLARAKAALDAIRPIIEDPSFTTSYQLLKNEGQTLINNVKETADDVQRVQQLVDNVNNVTDNMPLGVAEDIEAMLLSAEDLLELLRAQISTAETNFASNRLASLEGLSTNLQSIANLLKQGVGPAIDVSVLDAFLEALPGPAKALVGQTLLYAGIDQNLVNRLGTAVTDIASLQLIAQATPAAALPVSNNLAADRPAAANIGGAAPTCLDVAKQRQTVEVSAYALITLGAATKLTGEILKASGGTYLAGPAADTHFGAHGYAGISMKSDWTKWFGDAFVGTGAAIEQVGSTALHTVRACSRAQQLIDIVGIGEWEPGSGLEDKYSLKGMSDRIGTLVDDVARMSGKITSLERQVRFSAAVSRTSGRTPRTTYTAAPAAASIRTFVPNSTESAAATTEETMAESRPSAVGVAAAAGDGDAMWLRIRIESSLLEAEEKPVIGAFYRPRSSGGYLEDVRAVVSETIKQNVQIGINVGSAYRMLSEGDQQAASGQFKQAMMTYSRAYREAL